jgi:hypothetical protein
MNEVSVMALRELRGYWLGLGAPWRSPGSRPKNWDILEQVKHIQAEWR